jgi:hypothetical protein
MRPSWRIDERVPRTATGIRLLQEAAERRFSAVSRDILLELGNHMATKILQLLVAEDALVSGAMPADFSPRNLRTDFDPGSFLFAR